MSINDLPVLSALRTKMQWHQERQRVLSENVSNSDTPNFKPRDLLEPKFDSTGANTIAQKFIFQWQKAGAFNQVLPASATGSVAIINPKPNWSG